MEHRLRVLRTLALTLAAGLAPGPAAAQEGFLPECLLGLAGGSRSHALVVEKETEKLFLFEGDGDRPPRLVRVWNATTGQNGGDKLASGDLKTPEGIYFFTKALEDHQLPAEYGVRALVMDYPNRFDLRKGKTGSGIWLHASDEILRPFTSRRTRGCVVVTNHDVVEISRYVEFNESPIVVEEKVGRMTPAAWRAARAEVLAFLDSWRRDWSAGDFRAYGAHYAAEFRAEGKDRGAWIAQKAAVAAAAGPLAVSVVAPTILRQGDEVIVRFGQVYRSALRSDYGRKTLWLVREPGKAAAARGRARGQGPYRIIGEEWSEGEPTAAARVLLAAAPSFEPPADRAPREEVASLAPVPVRGGVDLAAAVPRPARDEVPPAAMTDAALSRAAPKLALALPAGERPGLADPSRLTIPLDADLPVALSGFLADLGGGEVRVSFRLDRVDPAVSAAAASGRLFVLVKLTTARGPRTLVWPRSTRLENGEPATFESGDWYSIRRYKEVEAVLPGAAAEMTLDGASVLVYDARGRRIFRQDFGG